MEKGRLFKLVKAAAQTIPGDAAADGVKPGYELMKFRAYGLMVELQQQLVEGVWHADLRAVDAGSVHSGHDFSDLRLGMFFPNLPGRPAL